MAIRLNDCTLLSAAKDFKINGNKCHGRPSKSTKALLVQSNKLLLIVIIIFLLICINKKLSIFKLITEQLNTYHTDLFIQHILHSNTKKYLHRKIIYFML